MSETGLQLFVEHGKSFVSCPARRGFAAGHDDIYQRLFVLTYHRKTTNSFNVAPTASEHVEEVKFTAKLRRRN